MKKKDFIKLLKSISKLDDSSRDYEVELTLFVNSNFKIEMANNFLKSMSTTHDFTKDLKIYYSAFYCINIYHRTHYNKELLDAIWNDYGKYFEHFNSFTHLKVNKFLLDLNSCFDTLKQRDMLQTAYDYAINYSENAGYQHAFAILYVSIIEKNDDQSFCNKITKKWYNHALEAINNAINLDPTYAKYYCTRGRLYSTNGLYKEADQEINYAIMKENSERKDYAIRVADYQYFRIQNQSKQSIKIIQDKIDSEQETINDLQSSVTSNIEIIAIFSGIISFVISSVNTANKQSTFHAGLLIIILMGGLTCALSAFSFLLHLGDSKYKGKGKVIIIIVSFLITILTVILSGVL